VDRRPSDKIADQISDAIPRSNSGAGCFGPCRCETLVKRAWPVTGGRDPTTSAESIRRRIARGVITSQNWLYGKLVRLRLRVGAVLNAMEAVTRQRRAGNGRSGRPGMFRAMRRTKTPSDPSDHAGAPPTRRLSQCAKAANSSGSEPRQSRSSVAVRRTVSGWVSGGRRLDTARARHWR